MSKLPRFDVRRCATLAILALAPCGRHEMASDVIGLFRSDDGGATWTAISDEEHQFGGSNVISGDPRRHGRVYLGTGGRGIIYGDPR